MSSDNIHLIQMIRDCDYRSLSPKALTAVEGILDLNAYVGHECKASAIIYEMAETRYDEATTLEEKQQWLEALYRMAGVLQSLIHTDCDLEDECDERFDDLMAKHGMLNDTLLCYRMHRNLVSPAPYDPKLRTDFLQKCRQWVNELTEEEPQMWFSLPLTERLHRLWTLCAVDYKAELHFNATHFAPIRWNDITDCFYRCRQQFRRMEQPDIETLTSYYWTLCALYPDADGTNPEAYDEYFKLFDKTISTLEQGSDTWWQLMEISEHHRKDIAKQYHRYSLPNLSILHRGSMHDFRMTFYRQEFQNTDYYDIQNGRELKDYAIECAERLMPSFNKVLKCEIDFGTDIETEYLLTLWLALTMAEQEDQKEKLAPKIVKHLSQLPDSRNKTHLLAHLYIYGYDELFSEAFDTTSAWEQDTLSEEDRYIQHYLQEDYKFLHLCES